MTFTSLDTIIRRSLLNNHLPIHWYTQELFSSAECLRELNFDTLKIINSVSLPVSSYGSADLPSDFVDDVALNVTSGQTLLPIPKQNNISPLRSITTAAQFQPYGNADLEGDEFFDFPLIGGGIWYFNIDSYGGSQGGIYGQAVELHQATKYLRKEGRYN